MERQVKVQLGFLYSNHGCVNLKLGDDENWVNLSGGDGTGENRGDPDNKFGGIFSYMSLN